MAFGTEYVQTTKIWYAFGQFDIRTTTSHVGGNGHRAALAGAGDDLRFLLVKLRVQHAVRNPGFLQQPRNVFAGFHCHGTHQHGTPFAVQAAHLFDDGLELHLFGEINGIVIILA